jgi:amino acid adenylation domain-containing protein
VPELLQDWVGSQATLRPDAIAVVGNDETLTYGQLETFANQLARTLHTAGCRQGERVCLLMPKCPAAIGGILGIYKAGCVYVPLDPASPPRRLVKLLESCDTRWILAAGAPTRLLEEVFEHEPFRTSISIGWMDTHPPKEKTFRIAFSIDDVRSQPAMPVVSRMTRRDIAHILFTSGSTGIPKGVVITHANVIHFVEWAVKYFDLSPSDRISGHPPLHFDLSFFDIFGTFAAGAQLHLVPLELNLLPNKLAAFIRASELTQWFSVPSLLTYMAKFDVVRMGDFPTLKRLLWCGEVFPTPSLMYWMRRLPHVRFTNLYGPTEATIASSYYAVPQCPDDEKAAIPIGTACEGEELLVLDERLQPAAPEQVGDLYIRGVGLSPGYWREPDKTQAVFLRNPHSADSSDRIYKTGDLAKIGSDGLVYFLGRADSQIKSRGHRIELGEIETALNAIASMQECAVVALNSEGFEGASICCAYVPAQGAPITPAMLRKELSTVLPNYMLPSQWMALDALPKNANGKIDRRRLKEAFERTAAHAQLSIP